MKPFKAILGMDAAQAGIAFHLIDTDNNELAAGSLPASTEGMGKLAATLLAHKLHWTDLLGAIESTGPWHLPWCEKLHQLGVRTYVLNPLIAKRTTTPDNAIRDRKTDPLDAAGLAQTLLREHRRLERFLYRRDCPLFRLRRLQNTRQTVRENLTNLKKSLGTLLAITFPELRSVKLSDARQRALISAAPTPADILALDEASLKAIAGAKTQALCEAAARSFASAELAQASAPALQQLAKTIGEIEDNLAGFDTLIEQHAPEALGAERIGKAQTLPGFGEKTALVILANIPVGLLETPMPQRKLANKIQAQLGCEPRVRTSGQWTGKTKLSKRGNVQGRIALYQAASCAIMHDGPLQAIYRGLRARGKPHKVAIYDIGRRLIRRLAAVLKSNPQTLQTSSCLP